MIIENIETNEIECQKLVKTMNNIRDYQETLDMKVDDFEIVDNVYRNHQIRKLLWYSLKEWTELVEQWESVVFEDINVEEITRLSDEYFVKVTKCESRLPGSTAVDKLSSQVRNFKSTMPIVTALGNKKLEVQHWDEIKEVMNMKGEDDFALEEKQFTLGELIKFNIGDKQEEVVHISTTATQEFQLNAELRRIKEVWDETEFNVIKHKEGILELGSRGTSLGALLNVGPACWVVQPRHSGGEVSAQQKEVHTFLQFKYQLQITEFYFINTRWIYSRATSTIFAKFSTGYIYTRLQSI